MKILSAKLEWAKPVPKRSREDIRYIVIHHTDSTPAASPQEIHAWHLKRGWSGCGYHYLVYADGTVYIARPSLWVPACVQGFNRQSLCVAAVGRFNNYPPNELHLQTLAQLVAELQQEYPQAELVRHRDLNPTSCPGRAFPWKPFLEEVRRYEAHRGSSS